MSEAYAATRIHAMRGKILQKETYERLLKMQEREILSFLQSSAYKEDVEALAIKQIDSPEVIDQVLAKNQRRILEKLSRISGKEFDAVLRTTLAKNDRWNLKVIADALASKTPIVDALSQYGKMGTYDPQEYANCQNIESFLKIASKHHPELKNSPSVLNELVIAIEHIEEESSHATTAMHIDERNILTLIRSRKNNSPPEKTIALYIPGGTIRMQTLRVATNATTLENAMQILRDTPYRQVAENIIANITSGTSLIRAEHEIRARTLERIHTSTRCNPLGPDVLVRFVAEMEQEHANLRLIIKGKKLGVDEKFLREHIMVTA